MVFKKEIATGADKKSPPRYAKNFILTPASQTTITPPTAIKKDVPNQVVLQLKLLGILKC